jgi:hypothetical protein
MDADGDRGASSVRRASSRHAALGTRDPSCFHVEGHGLNRRVH